MHTCGASTLKKTKAQAKQQNATMPILRSSLRPHVVEEDACVVNGSR